MTKENYVKHIQTSLEWAVDRFNLGRDCEELLFPTLKHSPSAYYGVTAVFESVITHRLAYYLESKLRVMQVVSLNTPVSVDCEYDQLLSDEKVMMTLKQEMDELRRIRTSRKTLDENLREITVRPDIIVHQRLSLDLNLAVIEVKKESSSSKDEEKFARLKLSEFTSKSGRNLYGYEIGFLVLAGDKGPVETRKLEIAATYRDGQEVTALRSL